MTQLEAARNAALAMGDVVRHLENADKITTGAPSEASGTDDEERLAQDDKAALVKAATGRAQDAISFLNQGFPSLPVFNQPAPVTPPAMPQTPPV